MLPEHLVTQFGISLTMKEIIKYNNLEEESYESNPRTYTAEQTIPLFGSESETSCYEAPTVKTSSKIQQKDVQLLELNLSSCPKVPLYFRTAY